MLSQVGLVTGLSQRHGGRRYPAICICAFRDRRRLPQRMPTGELNSRCSAPDGFTAEATPSRRFAGPGGRSWDEGNDAHGSARLGNQPRQGIGPRRGILRLSGGEGTPRQQALDDPAHGPPAQPLEGQLA
jgi:hypothetical protein